MNRLSLGTERGIMAGMRSNYDPEFSIGEKVVCGDEGHTFNAVVLESHRDSNGFPNHYTVKSERGFFATVYRTDMKRIEENR